MQNKKEIEELHATQMEKIKKDAPELQFLQNFMQNFESAPMKFYYNKKTPRNFA